MAKTISRRHFLQTASVAATGLATYGCATTQDEGTSTMPNVILAMSDDQGWGDTGYNGHPVLQTPTLDDMARKGIRFDRFYSGAPVCSPTRGSCLTGRHPYRYGVFGANSGDYEARSKYPLPPQEITLAEVLRQHGYTTGHFGKWHLGDFDGPMRSSPADNGFDIFFSTVRKVPTCDPFGYFTNDGPFDQKLEGDDSAILMDRALEFMRTAADRGQPFFAVLWFHTPHRPIVATAEDRARYAKHSEFEQHFWGSLTALDTQMGRLRATLRELGQANDTMLWYCSDNGCARGGDDTCGSTGGLAGAKGTLYEGGVRVPGLLEWPSRLTQPRRIEMPCSTSDYFPTILDLLDIEMPDDRPMDGISLTETIADQTTSRSKPIAFEHRGTAALLDNRYKLIAGIDDPTHVELFDLLEDPQEKKNLATARPQVVESMRTTLAAWRSSVDNSRAGQDYT